MTIESLVMVAIVITTLLAVVGFLAWQNIQERQTNTELHRQILESNERLQLKQDTRARDQENEITAQRQEIKISTQRFYTDTEGNTHLLDKDNP